MTAPKLLPALRSPEQMQASSVARRVYGVVAEFPGVQVRTADVMAELGLSPKMACAHLRHLWQRNLVYSALDGTRRVFWIPDPDALPIVPLTGDESTFEEVMQFHLKVQKAVLGTDEIGAFLSTGPSGS